MSLSYVVGDGIKVTVVDIKTPEETKKLFTISYPTGVTSSLIFSGNIENENKDDTIPFADYAVLLEYLKNRV